MPDTPFSHIALKVEPPRRTPWPSAWPPRPATRSRPPSSSSTATAARCTCSDPNGLLLELTADHPDAETINATRQTTAREDLARWLAGDHTSNNTYR